MVPEPTFPTADVPSASLPHIPVGHTVMAVACFPPTSDHMYAIPWSLDDEAQSVGLQHWWSARRSMAVC